MDNYFILSSKVGDKWTKVTSDMTTVKLGKFIHIVGELAHLVTFHGILRTKYQYSIEKPQKKYSTP